VARVDRQAPGRLLPLLYVVEALLFAVLALLAGRAPVAPIVALAFIDASLAFIARTLTRTAAASILIPHELMPEGKAAFNLALAVATVAGPAAAGIAILALGPPSALLADAASFVLAAVLVTRLRAPREAVPACGPALRRLGESLRYINRDPTLRALIAGEGVAFVFFYLVVPVTVVYSTRSLHAGPGGYAALLFAWGIGIALGSAAQVRLARRIGKAMILVSTLAVAAGYIATAAAPTLLLACAASVVGGVGNGTQWASVETAIHQLVEERFRARVAAVLEALACVAPGAGILLGGMLTALLSARAAYALAGGGLVALVAAAWLSSVSLAPRVATEPSA